MALDKNHFSNKLLQEKERLNKKMSQSEGLGRHENLKESTQELSLYDNHPADMGTENYERSKDLALHDHEMRKYRAIELALEKIEAGDYGLCEGCRQGIDPARLEEIPETRFCLKCKEREEMLTAVRERPLEEDTIKPPFPRSKDPDYTLYDREDAWQDVARFNRLHHVHYEDVGEDEESRGNVEETDKLSNEDYRKQLE